jgi:hypothetical protein
LVEAAGVTDNYVQVPPNSSGLKIDTSELMVNGTTVERQRIVVADPTNSENFLAVGLDGSITVTTDNQIEYLIRIEAQLKRVARLLEILAGNTVALEEVF